jgi:membrane-associated phospholipid phosphatase
LSGFTENLRPLNAGPILPLLCLLMLAGCGTMRNGRGWGQEAIYPVSWARVQTAAYNALFDYQTLVPAAGALIFTIDDWDERTSDWAIDHTPLFSSVEDAQDASDTLRDILMVEAAATAFLTPSGDEPGDWLAAKARGALVELAAAGVTGGMTNVLKDAAGRERPDKRNDNSLPSAHASASFSFATLANRNLDAMNWPTPAKRTVQSANLLLATGVAWARVEGGRHYPSDILAGAALGTFISSFIHDAFLPTPEDNRFQLLVFPQQDGAFVQVAFSF